MEESALQLRQGENFDRLKASGLLEKWVDHHPEKWNHQEWLGLISEVDHGGYMPMMIDQLGELIEQMYHDRFLAQPKRLPRSAASADQIQTVGHLATAHWTDPYDFAQRRRFEPGDFWLGRCPLSGEPLGFNDDAHIWVNAGTGGGKGATVVIPNHSLWQGSLVSIDPKGTNATVTAARRGDGNSVCDGMKQNVAVLDPMGISKVEAKYRKRFNPLDALDPNEVKFVEKASALANAIVIRPEDEKDPFWNDSSVSLLKGIILHVKTAPEFEGKRTMKTVYQLAKGGDKEGAKYFNQQNSQEDDLAMKQWQDKYKNAKGKKPDSPQKAQPANPYDVLFRLMKTNQACDDIIPDIAEEMLELKKDGASNQWKGLRSSLGRHIEFMESKGLQACMETSDFKLSDLKHDPNGMSLFLCLNLDDMKTYNRWLRMMTTLIIYEMRSDDEPMATGHRLLLCLDEFAALGYLEQIEEGFSTLREYQVKIMVVTQYLQQLKKSYEKSWHGFLSNTSLRLFFSLDEETAKEVSGWMGEAEIVLNTKNTTFSANQNTGTAVSATRTKSQGGSQGQTASQTEGSANAQGTTNSVTDGKNFSIADGQTDSSSDGSNQSQAMGTGITSTQGDGGSQSRGQNRGSNQSVSKGTGENFKGQYGFNWLHKITGMFRDGEQISKNENTSNGVNSGTSWNDSRSWQKSHAQNQTKTLSRGTQHTLTKGLSKTHTKGGSRATSNGSTQTQTTNRSATQSTSHNKQWNAGENLGMTRNTTEGHGVSVTLNENIQKRPLILPHDLKRDFGKLEAGDAYFPGLALVLIGNENPVIVQRTLYYDDKGFDGIYDRHPRYPGTDPEPLLRLTKLKTNPLVEDLFYEDDDDDEYCPILHTWYKLPGEKVYKGEVLYAIQPGLAAAFGYDGTLPIHAQFSGTLKHHLISAGDPLEPESEICEIQYFLPDLWETTDPPIRDAEFDRFIEGDHPMVTHHQHMQHEQNHQHALVLADRQLALVTQQIERRQTELIRSEQHADSMQVSRQSVMPDERILAAISEDLEDEFKNYKSNLPWIIGSCVAIPATFIFIFILCLSNLGPAKPSYPDMPSDPEEVSQGWFESDRKYYRRLGVYYQEKKDAESTRSYRHEKYKNEVAEYEKTAHLHDPRVNFKIFSGITWFLIVAGLMGLSLGANILRSTFLKQAWINRIQVSNYGQQARDEKRIRFFKTDDWGETFTVIGGITGFCMGIVIAIISSAGLWTLLICPMTTIFGTSIGKSLGNYLFRITRRIYWATTQGELVDLNKNLIPFDPLEVPKNP